MAKPSNRDARLMKAAESFIKVGDEEAAFVLLELAQAAEAKQTLSRLGKIPKKKTNGISWWMLLALVSLCSLGAGFLGYFGALQIFASGNANTILSDTAIPNVLQESDTNEATARAIEFRETQAALELGFTESAAIIQATTNAIETANPLGATQAAAQTKLAATATP